MKARGSLGVWLDRDMPWLAEPTGRRGRHPIFSEAVIQLFLSFKCLFGLSLRQSLGPDRSLLQLAQLDCPVPDCSTVCRRQARLHVQLSYRPNTTALDLPVDSTGIKFIGEGEWKRKKHGAEYRRQWRKVHLGIDKSTLEIHAIEAMAHSFARQVVGLHARIALLNRFTHLGTPVTVAVASLRLGSEETRPETDLRNKAGSTLQ